MGLREILKSTELTTTSGCDRKKPNMVIIWIIIIAVLILAFGSFFSADDDGKTETREAGISSDYEEEQEKRLEKILKKINGAGDVTVYIKLEDGGESVTAKNEKSITEESQTDGSDTSRRAESETSVVMSGKGSASEPYVVKERAPQVAGVLVVATGAADEAVRLKIYDAIKALYGVNPHRIEVTY